MLVRWGQLALPPQCKSTGEFGFGSYLNAKDAIYFLFFPKKIRKEDFVYWDMYQEATRPRRGGWDEFGRISVMG